MYRYISCTSMYMRFYLCSYASKLWNVEKKNYNFVFTVAVKNADTVELWNVNKIIIYVLHGADFSHLQLHLNTDWKYR